MDKPKKVKIPKEIIKQGEQVMGKARSLLMRKKFFYANILKQFRVVVSPEVDTMGVTWVKDRMYLIYNPEFVTYYEPKELRAIIEHEVDHFVFEHVTNFKEDGVHEVFKDEDEAKKAIKDKMTRQLEHRLQNIAMDRSINVYLKDLPKIRMRRGVEVKKDGDGKTSTAPVQNDSILGVYREGDVPENDIVEYDNINEHSFKDLLKKSKYPGDVEAVEKYQTWKYYYDLLKQCPDIQEQVQKIQDMDIHFQGTGDNLDPNGDGSSSFMEGLGGDEQGKGKDGPDQNETNRIIMKAYRDSNASNIPGHLRSQIDQMLERMANKPVPWYTILRRHINKAMKTIMKNDINIRNTYYGGGGPKQPIINGYINDPLFKVGVIYDTSGSCASPEIQGLFWNEVEALRKAGAMITIYYTDAQVEHIQKVNPSKPLKVEDYEGKGGGGTDLDVGIVKSIEDKNNIHIMLSDCWMSFNLTRKDLKGMRVICASNTDDKMPDHYGPTIKINQDEL